MWLFGGVVNGSLYNDLWRYSVSTNEWTWVKRAQGPANQVGVSRCSREFLQSIIFQVQRGYGANCWTDNNNNLWLLQDMRFMNVFCFNRRFRRFMEIQYRYQ
ncbi:MAG: hypothetical protein IPI22_01865 [Bacteroidetes bacterium]|nr:hypothetical protein [Bacteroidota bacterium]